MTKPCQFQQSYISVLEQIAFESTIHLPPTLLIGPPGCGKSTIVRSVCLEADLEFREIRMDQPANLTMPAFLGKVGVGPDGLPVVNDAALLEDKSMVLYLGGLENAPTDILAFLLNLLQRRRYIDLLGVERRVGVNTWIIGELSERVEARLSRHHWIVAAFERRIFIEMPSERSKLVEAFDIVASSLNGQHTLRPDAHGFLAAAAMPENLHTLRRWLEIASSTFPTSLELSEHQLQQAALKDLKWALSRVSYRGSPVSIERVWDWASQFPANLTQTAVELIRQIATRYYFGERDYYSGLQYLISNSGIKPRAEVAFSQWQNIGKSAPRVAHDLKNQAHWNILPEINLQDSPERWPVYAAPPQFIIFADDFVGSGKTLSRLFPFGSVSPLTTLQKRYPTSKIVILVLGGFEESIAKFRTRLRDILQSAASLIVFKMFTDRDRCFHPSTTIIPDTALRKAMQQFCRQTALKHFPGMVPQRMYGFGNAGALIVFFNTVPNNTLPMVWYAKSAWRPLFPVSGLIS